MPMRPIPMLATEQLTAFCAVRTPCYEAWKTVREWARRKDPRGAKMWMFAAGFALGVQWTLVRKKLTDEEALDMVRQKLETMDRELERRARLPLLG